nr:unnamed protein product [Callosobruchus analis]
MAVDKLVCIGDFNMVDQVNTIMSTFDLKQIIDEPTPYKLQLYADDTEIYGSFKPENIKAACDVVNADVGMYVDLSADHCLVNKAEKTKILLFGSKEIDLQLNQK